MRHKHIIDLCISLMPHRSIIILSADLHLAVIEAGRPSDDRWRIQMKTMILAAVAALSLGVGAAYAAGGPVGFAHGSYEASTSSSR
jgi:hypothetical protein